MNFRYNPDELTKQAKVNAGTASSGTGLTGSDWAGMGVQLLGGYMADRNANKQAEEDRKRKDMLLARQDKETALQRMIDAQRYEDEKAQAARTQNMTGLNFLANLRGQSQQDARRRSFRDTLLKAGA